ncbi:MAG: tetratricopeptide repeat protein [Bacteroidota bacterium]
MVPKIYIALFTVFLLVLQQSFFAQTKKIDSLKALVAKAGTPEKKLEALFVLCEERFSLNTDTMLAFAAQARKIALQQHNELNIARANFYTYTGLLKNSLYDSVVVVCDSNLNWLAKKTGGKQMAVKFKTLKAQAFMRGSKFKEAIGLFYELLQEAEGNSDTVMQITTRNSIGWAHMEMNQYNEALNWFYKALSTSSNPVYYRKYSPLYSNMASTYNNIGNYDSAFYFIEKAIEGSKVSQQLSYLANALNIRADIFMNTKNNVAAEKDLTDALNIRKQVGDPFYIVSDMTQLSNFYAIRGQYQKGIMMAEQGLQMATQYKLDAKLPILYGAMAENYKMGGDYLHYSQVQEKIISLKDSLFEKNSAEALADLQTRYDVQKKENIIIQQKLDIISKDYLFYGMLALFVFLGTLGFLQYRNYRKKEKIKLEKLVEEQRLNETIAVIKAEEKERKRIAADLHDNLGAYAAAISSNVRSVRDAGQLSEALTHRLEQNAQDIVNELNNTIWVLKKENQQLTEISDRLKVWLQKLIHNYPAIQYDFDEQVITDITFSPASALQLFHILQECINNALRHSRCINVTISFMSDKDWAVYVADNGTGFSAENTFKGNGISNLQERAAACGWKISWQPGKVKGTVVIISDSQAG